MPKNLAKPGDLLLYRTSPSVNLKDKLICFFEKLIGEGPGIYYHVAILDATLDFKYQAVFPKTNRSAVDWSDPGLELWRIKNTSDLQINKMLQWSDQHLGEWYGLGKSLKCLLKKGRFEICTQFVLDSALAGKMDLQGSILDSFVSPDELIKYPTIYKV